MQTEMLKRFTAPDGAEIAYRLYQPSAPRSLLVLIHGHASNMTRWSEFVRHTALKNSWDILRLDLRGQGNSLYRGRIRMQEWCDDLAALLDSLGYPQAVLAGHCLGANIAAHFAQRYPKRTRALIFIEPILRNALTGKLKTITRLAFIVKLVIALVRLANRLGIYRRTLSVLDLEKLDQETRAAMAAQGSSQALVKRYASPFYDLHFVPTGNFLQGLLEVTRPVPNLAQLHVPVLVLLSTGKAFSDPAITQASLETIPQHRVEILPSHHWIPMECPEAMRRIIETWCTQLPPAPT